MKRFIYPLAVGTILLSLISSCKKHDNSVEKFSTASVEENKALVETAGTNFVKVLNRMESLETIDVINNLNNIMSGSNTKGYIFQKNNKILSTFSALAGKTPGENIVKNVFSEMVSPKGMEDDQESIQQWWNDNVGTYTWNDALGDWDKALGGDKFIFKFPSSNVSPTNDAIFTVSNYSGVTIANPVDEDYSGDLPVSLSADLKVGTNTLITYTFSATYNNDGIPSAIASDLTIEDFKFETDISNNSKAVSVSYKFLENSDLIMELSASGEGLFTQSNYDAHTETHTETHSYIVDYIWDANLQQYVPVYDSYTDEWKETEFEEILNSANCNFQLFDIAIRGQINIKGLVDQLRILDANKEDDKIDEETQMNGYAENINKFLNLRLVNVSKNEILAKAEAYVENEIDFYGSDYFINFRLTFSDGSPIDLETYFDTGFDDFIDDMNDFITNLNDDYDLDVDPIDY